MPRQHFLGSSNERSNTTQQMMILKQNVYFMYNIKVICGAVIGAFLKVFDCKIRDVNLG